MSGIYRKKPVNVQAWQIVVGAVYFAANYEAVADV